MVSPAKVGSLTKGGSLKKFNPDVGSG